MAKKFRGKCMCCANHLEQYEVIIHHLRYDNLWRERMNDLVAICRSCHDAIHFEWWEKLELTHDTTWWRYASLRFRLQEMHNTRIQRAKQKNEELRGKPHKRWRKCRPLKSKRNYEKKLNNPSYNREKQKFEYTPYVQKFISKREKQEILNSKWVKIISIRKKNRENPADFGRK